MRNTRAAGNRRENRVVKHLEALGYFCYPSRGSRGIDLIAIAPGTLHLPHLGREVGGEKKSVREAFGKMRLLPQCPGMVLLVVREIKTNGRNHFRWHAAAEVRGHDSFEGAVDAARKA